MADLNRKYIGQNEECRTHVYRGLDSRTLHIVSDQFALCCRDGARLSAYTLTTYKLRLGERPSPHNAKYTTMHENLHRTEFLSYTSTNKACSANTYNTLTLTLRYIRVRHRPYYANPCSLAFCCKKTLLHQFVDDSISLL